MALLRGLEQFAHYRFSLVLQADLIVGERGSVAENRQQPLSPLIEGLEVFAGDHELWSEDALTPQPLHEDRRDNDAVPPRWILPQPSERRF